MQHGILSFGAYIPSLRVDRAAIAAAHAWAFPSRREIGARALANWDEDCITMSVEAARGVEHAKVSAILFASTTAPFADLQNAAIVASALGLPEDVSSIDLAGSVRAGTSALLYALRSGGEGDQLVVAADARLAKPGSTQESQYGAGSVAFVVGEGAPIARLIGSASRAEMFVDHFRATGERFDYYWEERWARDEGYAVLVPVAIQAALDSAGVTAAGITHLCLPSLTPGASVSVARKSGIAVEAVADPLQAQCGDTGAAHGPMMLAAALEKAKPGDKILLVSFGAGCDVLLFEATDAISAYRPRQSVQAAIAAGRIESDYLKLLSFHGHLNLDWGMRAEANDKIPLTQQYRAHNQLATFMAGECADCGAVQFPQLASCVNCASVAPLGQRSLVNEPAKVATYTADWLQYHPSPPLYFGLVQFDNGARVLMEIVDVDPAALEVGTKLRMVYRIKSTDRERHYTRYFWKAAPLDPALGD